MKNIKEIKDGIAALEAEVLEMQADARLAGSSALLALRGRLNASVEMCEAQERWEAGLPQEEKVAGAAGTVLPPAGE